MSNEAAFNAAIALAVTSTIRQEVVGYWSRIEALEAQLSELKNENSRLKEDLMVVASKLGVMVPLDNQSAAIFLKTARKCGVCGHMAMIIINRLGKSHCISCDPGWERK